MVSRTPTLQVCRMKTSSRRVIRHAPAPVVRTGNAVLDRLIAEGKATPAKVTDGSVPRRAPADQWLPIERILETE